MPSPEALAQAREILARAPNPRGATPGTWYLFALPDEHGELRTAYQGPELGEWPQTRWSRSSEAWAPEYEVAPNHPSFEHLPPVERVLLGTVRFVEYSQRTEGDGEEWFVFMDREGLWTGRTWIDVIVPSRALPTAASPNPRPGAKMIRCPFERRLGRVRAIL